jgi:hypothetical protein
MLLRTRFLRTNPKPGAPLQIFVGNSTDYLFDHFPPGAQIDCHRHGPETVRPKTVESWSTVGNPLWPDQF